MSKLEDYKAKAPAIVGSTTINHRARVALGLNCSEYVLMDHLTKEKSDSDNLSIYINTGFGLEEITKLFESLIVKGFILIATDKSSFSITSKWAEGFPKIDKEFEEFWHTTEKNEKGKDVHMVAWTGAKKKALEYFAKLRKKHSFEYLMSQRDAYFLFLKRQKELRNFDQQRLMCQVFLNPATERFAENYEDYIKQLENKYGKAVEKPKPAAITRDQVNELYGKDSDQ